MSTVGTRSVGAAERPSRPVEFVEDKAGLLSPANRAAYDESLGALDDPVGLVLFVGSGPSIAIFGSWKDLLRALGKEAHLTQEERQSPFKFAEDCREKLGEPAYSEFLRRRFGDADRPDRYRDIHSSTVNTRFSSFVTTNCDCYLERAASYPTKPVIARIDSCPMGLPCSFGQPIRALYHIHGCIADDEIPPQPVHVVLTERDYQDGYGEGGDGVLRFLEEVNLCCLFEEGPSFRQYVSRQRS